MPINSEIAINNEKFIGITEKEELSEKNLLYLNKIINLAKQNNINLIFVKAPNQLNEKEVKKYNTIKEIAIQNGLDFIDYNQKFNELNLINGEDFYDMGHLSYKGAEKVSSNFSQYLMEN